MTPAAAIEKHRDAVHALVRRFDLSNPRLVGAAGENLDADSESGREAGREIDGETDRETDRGELEFLVDDRPGTTLFDIGGLQVALEDLLGMPVSVMTSGGLPESLRTKVLKEAMPV
ncbi:hypothetical protein ASG25_04005 [Rhizobium sp. Leaf384]|uniref:nucleotidyltransferase family protein n=1 Tax=unclassified Rhizobium TaxID=2613769 RepID=UPI000715642C|nr:MULTISPECIES: hypothetical protein [unclassified Rhizobium]KQR77438.1 hypothetical protein ASG03_13465 [Rhizobium sp. Leaf341]KQS77371.1 hypothetical protein ASG58_10320 [Rhizobium sp. Leaf383]KQS80721.1 hypothetical protein ASG25_04005 [Rhizobium sp. Leaf384]